MVTFGEPLWHVIPLRGPFFWKAELAMTPSLSPVCRSETFFVCYTRGFSACHTTHDHNHGHNNTQQHQHTHTTKAQQHTHNTEQRRREKRSREKRRETEMKSGERKVRERGQRREKREAEDTFQYPELITQYSFILHLFFFGNNSRYSYMFAPFKKLEMCL